MNGSNSILLKGGTMMLSSDIISRFNEIYDSTNKSVLAFITSRCGNTADINDIFQDTYMELYQILNKYGANHVADGKAYVFRIAKRKLARNYSVLKQLRTKIVSMTKDGDGEDNAEMEIPDTGIESFLTDEGPEDYIVNQILLENARQFIQQKPTDTKRIFYLFYDVGLSIPKIAKNLSLKESNVKNKLYRTVKELQNFIEKGDNYNEKK